MCIRDRILCTNAFMKCVQRFIMIASLSRRWQESRGALTKALLKALKALLKSIKTKNKLYKKYLQVPTVDNSSLYKTYKNKLNQTLRLAKRWYYEKKLEDAKSNTHATWKILNEVLNRKKSRPQLNTIFKSDGQEISDPVEVANRFCSYFSSLSLIHIWRCRRSTLCRSRWSPYH